MIGSLDGKLTFVDGQSAIISVGGVGYEVVLSAAVRNALPGLGESVHVTVYTDVKETSITLFGFHSRTEKEMFLLLKRVKGIGSKLALCILSEMNPEQLLVAIGQEDVSALSRTPGIGRKTAERVIVELREQVAQLAQEIQISLASQVEREVIGRQHRMPPAGGDAVLALEKLGFPPDRARVAVAASIDQLRRSEQSIPEDSGELLRLALASLSKLPNNS